MKLFKGPKDYDKILSSAQEGGYIVDTSAFDIGGDSIFLDKKDSPLSISYNVVNGNFSVYCETEYGNTLLATNLSEEFDDHDWYTEILLMFYKEIDND